jgi:uncharacterized repeat protein (TIGR03843 family)
VTDGGRPALTIGRAVDALSRGELSLRQQIAWSSNAAFLVEVSDGDVDLLAVYKPRRGETPLWDFEPGTLCLREMAAFVASEAIGWHLVPPTALRAGPLGFGALQVFVPHDPDRHYLALEEPDVDAVARIAAFDVVINNADRKSGHVLLADDGALWAIDHGVSFHVQPKLRTVIWELAGQSLPADIRADLQAFAAELEVPGSDARRSLATLLNAAELEALAARSRGLLDAGIFPEADPTRRAIPWPPI